MKYVSEGIRCNGKKEMIVDTPICRKLKDCWDVLKIDIVDFLNGSFCKSVAKLQSIYSVRGYSKVVDISQISYKKNISKAISRNRGNTECKVRGRSCKTKISVGIYSC